MPITEEDAGAAASRHTGAAEANRRFYAKVATTYEDNEWPSRRRRHLKALLADVVPRLRANAAVLDGCGGTGIVSLQLLERGLEVVTVDVSTEMLELYRNRAVASGYTPQIVEAGIEEFLTTNGRRWDLIVFSSALHHLDDYARVIQLSLERLAPGGILLTMFDPAATSGVGRRLRRLDYIAHTVLRSPGRVPGILTRRLAPLVSRAAGCRSVGEEAEVHALTGVDDARLIAIALEEGAVVLRHERFFEGRFAITRKIASALGQPATFNLILQRPSVAVRAPAAG